MKIKALVSFGGTLSMTINEVRDVEKDSIVSDLLRCGYVEEIVEKAEAKTKRTKKAVTSDEAK